MFACKINDKLTHEEIMIRTKVFVEEQGFKEEFDTADSTATHLVFFDDNASPAGCLRIIFDSPKACHIGRVAVLPKYRKQSLGSIMMKKAEDVAKEMGALSIVLSAQCSAKAFYIKNGYTPVGEIYFDEFCPHIKMIKDVK